MKRLIFTLLALSLLNGACENNQNNVLPHKVDQQLLDATNEMARLIDEGDDFDVEQIKWRDCWYLDAKMKYNDDLSMVTEIVSAIGGAPWHQERELVVSINYNNVVKRYELSESGDVVVVQSGIFDFYSRIMTLYIDLEAQGVYEATSIEAKLLAYTDDSFIIEWQAEDGHFRALFKRVDYAMMERKGAEIKVNAMLADAGELDVDSVAERILGSWVADTRVEYDGPDYLSICHIDALLGYSKWIPYHEGFVGTYTFSSEGTLTNVFESEMLPEEIFTYTYTWSYDADTNMLSVEGDNQTTIYSVIALSDEWLFVDYEVNERDNDTGEDVTKYLRNIYRRKVK